MYCSKLSIAMILTIIFWGANTVFSVNKEKPDNTSEEIIKDLPNSVKFLFLFEMSSLKQMSSGKFVRGEEDKHILRANRGSIEWIRKVIAPDWLPDDPNYFKDNLTMIQNEYGPIDATHIIWQKNNYEIKISQTMTVFTIKLELLKSFSIENTIDSKRQRVKEIATQIINDNVDIEEIGPVSSKIVKKNIRSILLSSSFDKAKIQNYDDIIHGKSSDIDTSDKSDFAYRDYWWRRINWWTDGKIVGIYTLKTEGGAWKPAYSSGIDSGWFEGN